MAKKRRKKPHTTAPPPPSPPPGGAPGSSPSGSDSAPGAAPSGTHAESPGLGKKLVHTAGRVIVAGGNEIKNTAADGVKGTRRYITEKASEGVHAAVSQSEQDNAAVETAHKVERVGETLVQQGVRKGKEKAGECLKKAADERNTDKNPATPAHSGKLHHGAAPAAAAKASPLKFSNEYGAALGAMWDTPAAEFGAHVDFGPAKPGLAGKTLGKGKDVVAGGIRAGVGRAALQFNNKIDQHGGDNSAVKVAHHAEQLAERPAKYVLKKGTNLAVKPVKTLSNKLRSRIRHKFLIRKQMFLARHKNIAQARGVVMKAKAIVRELFVRSKPVLTGLGICLALYFIMQMIVGPLTAAFTHAGAQYLVTTTYPVANQDITHSTVQWTELEIELEQRIENIEDEFPDIDEFRYDIQEMEFNPFELISFLAAMHLEFTHPEVQALIAEIFGEVNELQLIEQVEIRTRTVMGSDGEPEEEEYEWRILYVILHPKPFVEVVTPRLEAADAKELFEIFMGSGGNQQAFGNPFAFNWLGNVTSHYGYRRNPTGPGFEFHTGIDIAAPGGTPIRSVQNGVVVVAQWHNLYGNYIVIRNELGISSLYAHCSEMFVSVGDVVRTGQIIAAVGSTGNSTGDHLHLELQIDSVRVNPIFFIQAYDD